MKTLRTISFILYGLIGLLGFFFAFMYLFRSEFMPYHAIAVEKSWEEVDAGLQVLVIALMRVSGGGWLATSVAITMLLIGRIRYDKLYFGFTLMMVGLTALIPTLYATLYVRGNSPANPPWIAAVMGIVILLAGFIMDYTSRKMTK